jgi:triacylglycerol lipase
VGRAKRARRRTAAIIRFSATRHPIVLAHGYLGFGSLAKKALSGRYFRGVREFLESLGCDVHVLVVPATASVAVRAEALARQVQALRAERVNIIAHSMGGLDARYAISKLGLSSRVASLITVGTPHRGTPIADLLGLSAREMLGEGLRDLTTERVARFNDSVPDAESVLYGSIVGAASSVSRFLAPAYDYLLRTSGRNDGLVPASSQPWGRLLREVDADHLAQIGWARRVDFRALYAPLVTYIASVGL